MLPHLAPRGTLIIAFKNNVLSNILKLNSQLASSLFWIAFTGCAGMLAMPSSAQETPTGHAQANVDTASNPIRRPRRLLDSMAVDPSKEWVPTFINRDRSAELERKIVFGTRALDAGNLTAPPHDNALAFFSKALEINPEDPRALEGARRVAAELVRLAWEANGAGDRSRAIDLLSQVESLQPDYAEVADVRAEIARTDELNVLLGNVRIQVDQDRLIQPAGNNALESLQAVLAIEPENELAAAGMAEIEAELIRRTTAHLDVGDYSRALAALDDAGLVFGKSEAVNQTRIQVLSERQDLWDGLIGDVSNDIKANRLDTAEAGISALLDRGYDGSIAMLDSQLQEMRRLDAYRPGEIFADKLRAGDQASLMVVVARGSFTMGSPRGEKDRRDSEGPLQNITFSRPYAVSQREITVSEFRRFVAATNYVTDAEKTGSSTIYVVRAGRLTAKDGVDWHSDFRGDDARDTRPVIHVSWNDAAAYAAWLTEQTGESYRLPTEAEFENALRAGTTSPYWWGDGTPPNKVENLTGSRDKIANWEWPDAFDRYGDGNWGPAAGGSYEANPYGFHDIGGNVMEWVSDCFEATLRGMPLDGSARHASNCPRRVIKGGSWASPPRIARSAYRGRAEPNRSSCMIGFRVARDL